MSKPCTPLHLVKLGAAITPRIFISAQVVQHLTYAKECADVGGGLVAGTARLEIVEISPMTLNSTRWLKVAIVGTTPSRILKLTSEEYMSKFLSAD